jgi:hypothetical protein
MKLRLCAAGALLISFLGPVVSCGGGGSPPAPPPAASCQGQVYACGHSLDEMTDEATCVGQLGCEFVPSSCSGQVVPCSDQGLQDTDCMGQSGCQFTAGPNPPLGTCSGTATPCAMLQGNQCGMSLGCLSSLSRCDGTARACTAITDSRACANQRGCTWQ